MKAYRYVLLLLCVPYYSFSSTFNYTVSGDISSAENIVPSTSGNGSVSTLWDPATNAQAAFAWRPLNFTSATATEITVKNMGKAEESVSIPIRLLGVEFNKSSPSNWQESEVIGSGNDCPTSGDTANITYVEGDSNCGYPKFLENTQGSNQVPISGYRAIVELDHEQLPQVFKDAKVGNGTYYGTIISQIGYDYYRDSFDNPKLKKTFNISISVKVKYQGGMITDIKFRGEPLMSVSYPSGRVVGKTHYDIYANGWFTDGIDIELVNSGKDYTLSDSSGNNIPYSVSCEQCDDESLIKDGRSEVSSTKVKGENIDTIFFRLKFQYNVEDNSFPTGYYTDSLILLVNPVI